MCAARLLALGHRAPLWIRERFDNKIQYGTHFKTLCTSNTRLARSIELGRGKRFPQELARFFIMLRGHFAVANFYSHKGEL
jgi:hypothetical protein